MCTMSYSSIAIFYSTKIDGCRMMCAIVDPLRKAHKSYDTKIKPKKIAIWVACYHAKYDNK